MTATLSRRVYVGGDPNRFVTATVEVREKLRWPGGIHDSDVIPTIDEAQDVADALAALDRICEALVSAGRVT